MEHILVVASFGLDESMAKKSSHMFAELDIIVNLHSEGGVFQIAVVSETIDRASAPEERRKKWCIFNQNVTYTRRKSIVWYIESPAH